VKRFSGLKYCSVFESFYDGRNQIIAKLLLC
jgi:hypothetical protein